MTSKDSLGDRMKRYEDATREHLLHRMPIIVRVDGKAFHSWTRGMSRPFDATLTEWMDRVALALCRESQGCVLAYMQSDEVSLLLHPFRALTSQAWFDGNIQKIASVSAACAASVMTSLSERFVMFDARAFVLPEREVCNYFLWRQQDATRNSIQMLARSMFSHTQCNGKNCDELQEMCFQAGRNWNDLPPHLRRGRCAARTETGWEIDNEIPIWKGEDRAYIERLLVCE